MAIPTLLSRRRQQRRSTGAVTTRSLTTDEPGVTHIDGGSVVTTAAQSYGDAVTVDFADLSLSGTDVTFHSTLKGTKGVTVNASKTTEFVGSVELGALETDAPGNTIVDGASIITRLDQTFGDDAAHRQHRVYQQGVGRDSRSPGP